MSEESPDGRGWGLERYVARSDADWFGYLSDAEDFYEKGLPGRPISAVSGMISSAWVKRSSASTKAAAPGVPYTYANNPWRGADVAPLGSNIARAGRCGRPGASSAGR
jgi:hypothetical protein